MEGGQSGTYLRLTRELSGLRVSVAKTQRPSSAVEYNEEGLCVWAEIFIFVSFSSLHVLTTLTHGPDDALVSRR